MTSFGEKSLGKALHLQAWKVTKHHQGCSTSMGVRPTTLQSKRSLVCTSILAPALSAWIRGRKASSKAREGEPFEGNTSTYSRDQLFLTKNVMSSRSNQLRHVSVQVVPPKLAVPWRMLRCCTVPGLLHVTRDAPRLIVFLTWSRSWHKTCFVLWFGGGGLPPTTVMGGLTPQSYSMCCAAATHQATHQARQIWGTACLDRPRSM